MFGKVKTLEDAVLFVGGLFVSTIAFFVVLAIFSVVVKAFEQFGNLFSY